MVDLGRSFRFRAARLLSDIAVMLDASLKSLLQSTSTSWLSIASTLLSDGLLFDIDDSQGYHWSWDQRVAFAAPDVMEMRARR